MTLSRRKFLTSVSLLSAGVLAAPFVTGMRFSPRVGKAPVPLTHFPNSLYAFIWRNWNLVPIERMAAVVGAQSDELRTIAKAIGLPIQKVVSQEQLQRSYLTIIRRNWHLLPREQLLTLLEWTDEKLTFTLQEDDFFYVKLGSLKPECEPIKYTAATTDVLKKQEWLAKVVEEEMPNGVPVPTEPLFQFVKDLSKAPAPRKSVAKSGFAPRFGYAYFALFGDPLLDTTVDPYPDGYLEQMAASGMDGTWMHIVLSKITPFPWEPTLSEHWETRLNNLAKMVQKAKKHGIGIYLYLNEPRFMPLSFFEKYPDLKGVTINGQASLCTSHPKVQEYLTDSMALITSRVPDLAGFFSITASENPTNCWSHFKGAECPRCSKKGATQVISELNGIFMNGIKKGHTELQAKNIQSKEPRLIAWDWGWPDGWAEGIIPALPSNASFMSVSEWDLPIERGGIKNKVGEYSISSIGPGPRALRHWEIAKKSGLKTIAKIQAGNTWEIAAVPYIPALENVATHAYNLRKTKVDGLMLGWSLGGYPSPNLEVVAEMGSNQSITPIEGMTRVANRRFGVAGNAVTKAWRAYSKAFSEFPYHIGVVYNAPSQVGPSNLLWSKPTGYRSTMVGIPYDDVTSWRATYPVAVFTSQLQKVSDGFNAGLAQLKRDTKALNMSKEQRAALNKECGVAETVALHYGSIVNQVQFNELRGKLTATRLTKAEGLEIIAKLENILKQEIKFAKRMSELQSNDSRLGFEASNHYFYVLNDLAEKIINCRDLLDHWLPDQRKLFV